MELWQFYRILRRRKWLIIIGTMLCVGVVFAFVRFGRDKYEAYTTVMEKISSDDKVDIYGPAYGYQFDPKVRLANLAQLVRSRTVIERASQTLSDLKQISDPEKILQTLDVTPVLDTTILEIRVRSENDDQAKATADVVAKEFIAYYNEMNYGGATKSKEFIQAELPKAEMRLRKIREQMRQFKQANGLVMLDHQTDMLLQQMNQVNLSLAQYRVQANEAKARVRGLEQKLNDFPETRVVSKTMATNPQWQSLQVDLGKQQIELQSMLRKRTPEHPEVQALQRQITETERQLKDAAATVFNSQSEAVNPIRDNVLQQYISAMVDSAAGDAAVSSGESTLSAIQPNLTTLPMKEMQMAQLTLDEQSATNTYQLLRQKLDEATIKEKEAQNSSSIQIVDPARSGPADTKKKLKLILACILAPVFCSGIALLLNYLDNSVKTPADAEDLLQLPIFAVVPLARSHTLLDKKSLPAIDTSFQMLSTNLWFGNTEMIGHTVLVASAEPDVGRSITVANLAVTLARDGARVILVDCDMRQPSQHTIFKVENERGLSNVLAGKLPLKDALKPTSQTDLLLLPSGPLPANPVKLLRSPEMEAFVKDINELADYVIFDSPAGITFADATLLAALVKNVVIVYAAGTVPRGAEAEFRNRLEQVDANLLGAVLNMVNPEDSHGFYHFRVGYEELLKNGKGSIALAERMLQAIPEEKSEDKSSTES